MDEHEVHKVVGVQAPGDGTTIDQRGDIFSEIQREGNNLKSSVRDRGMDEHEVHKVVGVQAPGDGTTIDQSNNSLSRCQQFPIPLVKAHFLWSISMILDRNVDANAVEDFCKLPHLQKALLVSILLA